VPRRGRPPSARGIVSIDVLAYSPPDHAVLDTSYVVEALLSGQTYHEECAEALEHVVELSRQVSYSSLLELELIEACYQVALRDQYDKGWKQARRDGRARRRASRIAEEALAAWSELVGLGFDRVEASAVADEVPHLMHRYALGSYDAVHAATALAVRADGLIALDTAFARVPKTLLTIHTVSAKGLEDARHPRLSLASSAALRLSSWDKCEEAQRTGLSPFGERHRERATHRSLRVAGRREVREASRCRSPESRQTNNATARRHATPRRALRERTKPALRA
jgi:predicted nucleic acid-binding protein